MESAQGFFSVRDCEQAIDVLREFRTMVRSYAESMKSEAQTCAANMQGDTIAENASADLEKIMDRIINILDEEVKNLISGLEQEKETAMIISQWTDDQGGSNGGY